KAVELQLVDQGPVVSMATYTGTALPYESVNINARVDGTIQKLKVYEGEYVKAGTVLAKLDTSHLKPLYDKALAESRFWQAEWGRARELYEDKVISALERDRVRKSYETSAAQAQQMWAQLNYATVKTPVGGWIAKRKAFQGQYIHKGEMMFRVDRLDALRIQFHVSERDLPFIRNGDPVWLEFPQMSMLAFDRNGWRDKIRPSTEEQIATSLVGKEPFVNVADRVLPDPDKQATPGLIAEVAVIFPSVDPKTHTGIVEARIGNPGTLLKSDSYVVGHFRVAHVNDVVRVPSKAVLQLPDKRNVIFVGPAFSDEGNAELREVQVGLIANGRAEILSGVEANEFVIVRGQRNLSDGEFVTVVKRNGGF
ncbi:MAG: efflux RND transporter periplasmic adaptor subunit, partial [Nitrospinae bacterium]|nr:efflux RND transporter periplasmic adaptor subunit [Nitrospinota bacterium]